MAIFNHVNTDACFGNFGNIFRFLGAETVENGVTFSYLNHNGLHLDDIEVSGFGLGFSGGTNRYTRIITNKQIALENTDETNPNVVIS